MRPHHVLTVSLVAGLCLACGGDSPSGPTERPVPPLGPNWSVLPIPLEKVAGITALGHNNKALPNYGTYWRTCDMGVLLPSPRPCVHEQLPVRAPADGVVFGVDHVPDGLITIEAPPGLFITFGHVTPRAGIEPGDPVEAGEVVATMFFTYSLDVTVLNYGITPHPFVNMARMSDAFVYAQNAIAQFPEPTRSELIARVKTLGDPMGRVSWDQAGTAAGAWFLEGTPVARSTEFDFFPNHLFLGRLAEREETRIMTVGTPWSGQPNSLVVIDPAEPSWDTITPASGVVALAAWGIEPDGTANYGYPHGTVLVAALGGERIRVEWFDTHDPVTAFTPSSRIYER
jgi:hypothetical protein